MRHCRAIAALLVALLITPWSFAQQRKSRNDPKEPASNFFGSSCSMSL